MHPASMRCTALSILLYALLLALLPTPATAAPGQTLTITSGGTYGGTWDSIVVNTTQPVTIARASLRGPGDLITSSVGSVVVTVRNCTGIGTPPADGVAQGRFVFFFGAKNVTVENNYTENTAGIKVWDDGRTTQFVRIRFNQGRNINNRLGSGAGGYRNKGVLGNWIHFNKLKGVDAEIAWNEEVNAPYDSYVEDSISTYCSSGTPAKPINRRNPVRK